MFVNLKDLMRNRNEARKREYAAAKNLQMVRNDKEASRREKYASMQRLHESQELANSFNKEKNKRSTKKEKLKTVVVGLSCAAVLTGIAFGIDQYKRQRRQPLVNSDYSNVSRDNDDEKYQEPVTEAVEEKVEDTKGSTSSKTKAKVKDEEKIETTYQSNGDVKNAKTEVKSEEKWEKQMSGTTSVFIPAKEILSNAWNLDAAVKMGNVEFDDTYLDIIAAAKIDISTDVDSVARKKYLKIF